MEINYHLIDNDNRESFEGVIPEALSFVDTRIAVGAVDEEGNVLGAISYILTDYEYFIDWIFVEPEFRRHRIGSGLLGEVFDIIMSTGDRFPVTARFEFSEDDYAMHTFFLSCQQMTTSFSHDRYYVTADDVRLSEKLHKSAHSDVSTSLFFEMPEVEQKKILTKLAREQTYVVEDYDIWKKACVPELCRCVYVRNNLVDLIFMQKLPYGNLELSYLYGKYPRGLFELLAETVKEMEKIFPHATLTFEAMSDESETLASNLFPRAKKVHIYEAEY